MKIAFFSIALIIGHLSFAQSPGSAVNRDNYYSHFQNVKGHSINWLRSSDAVPVIIDQLLRANIPYHTISVGSLLNLNDSTRLVLTVSFEKDRKRYGFVYEANHGIPLNPKDRDYMTDKQRISFVQTERDLNGNVKFMHINDWPDNVFLLKQTCYWYQFDKVGTVYSVSKEVAKEILRGDVQYYLQSL